jgi:HSP20 family protein
MNTLSKNNNLFSFLDESFSPIDLFFGQYNNKFTDGILSESEDGYKYQLAVPGLTKNDVNISFENNIITVSYKLEKENSFISSSFSDRFSIPENAINEKISAKVENGILLIKIPKEKKKEFRKTITIE